MAEGKRGGIVKDQIIKVRATTKLKSKLSWLADTYAGGNASMWIAWAIENAPRRHLVKKI